MLTQNNWSELQTILKETTLAVTTVKSKEDEIQSEFSKNLADFYKLKRKAIRLRENNLKVLGISSTSKPLTKIKVEISQNEDDLSYYLSIKQFLFEFRNNPDILLQFIGTLTNSDDQYLAAKVLMHFFFEDVTQAESSAPLEDMLTMFLSKEIPNVPDFFVDSFPSESNFFGKLIKEMGNRNEVKVHVKDIVADIVKELESYQYNQNEYHVTLNIGELNQILVDVKENNGKNRNDSFEVIDKNNTGNYDIRKSKPLSGSMHYKTRSMNTTGLTIDKAVNVTKSIYFPNYGNSNNDLSKMQTEDGLYGNLINIDSKYLRNAMKNETNEFMKIFYMKHINNITSEDKEGMYLVNTFRTAFSSIQNYEPISELYLKYFTIIKNLIKKLLDNIMNNIPFLPKIIKHTAQKIFYMLREQHPNIDEVTLDMYIANFYIQTIIIPTLLQPETNEFIMSDKICSMNTHKSLQSIAIVLRNLARCELFSIDDNNNYVIFNTFILENVSRINAIVNSIVIERENDIFYNVDQSMTKSEDIYQVICLSKREIYLFLNKFNQCKMLKDKTQYYNLNEEKKDIFSDVIEELKEKTEKEKEIYYLFLNMNLNEERKRTMKIEHKKEKISSYNSPSQFINEIKICIKYVLSNVPEISSQNTVDVENLFLSLHQMISHYHKDYDKILQSQIPLNWYSNYIITTLKQIPPEYSANNYSLLYKELMNETDSFRTALVNKNCLLVGPMSSELTSLKKITKLAKNQYKHLKDFETTIKMRYFIQSAKLEVCLLNGVDNFNVVYDYNKKGIQENVKLKEEELILKTQLDCSHAAAEKMSGISGLLGMNAKLLEGFEQTKRTAHCNSVDDFIKQIVHYGKDIVQDILKCVPSTMLTLKATNNNKTTNPTNANEVIEQYINYIEDFIDVKEHYKTLITSPKNPQKKEIFMDRLQNFIKTKISHKLKLPISLLDADIAFLIQCKRLLWLDPFEHLKIPKEAINDYQMEKSMEFMRKMDKEKFCDNILSMFSKAIDVIVKMYKFTLANEGATLDDFLPIICYIIIQVKPKKMISNFANCQYFMSEKNKNQNMGYNLTNMHAFIAYINGIDHIKVGMENQEKEFNERCDKSLMEDKE